MTRNASLYALLLILAGLLSQPMAQGIHEFSTHAANVFAEVLK